MTTYIVLGVLLYCVIGFIIHQGMTKEWKDDTSPPEIPEQAMKTGLFLCSLFWPVFLMYVFLFAGRED